MKEDKYRILTYSNGQVIADTGDISFDEAREYYLSNYSGDFSASSMRLFKNGKKVLLLDTNKELCVEFKDFRMLIPDYAVVNCVRKWQMGGSVK